MRGTLEKEVDETVPFTGSDVNAGATCSPESSTGPGTSGPGVCGVGARPLAEGVRIKAALRVNVWKGTSHIWNS